MGWKDTLSAIAISVLFLVALAYSLGESPAVFVEAALSGLQSQHGIWGTLGYATLLLCTALAIKLPMLSGYFNIGVEGQMVIGGVAGYFGAQLIPQSVLSPWLGVSFALLGAALWAFIPALLKSWRNVHEVVSGIFLNFIATAILAYLVSGPWKDPESWSPESPQIQTQLPFYPPDATNGPSVIFLLALASLPLLSAFVRSSLFGLTLRAMRKSKDATVFAGLSPTKTILIASCLAGCFAGLAGAHDVLATSGRLRDAFSGGFGFLGIGVALLAGQSFWMLAVSALFFGALLQTGTELQIVSEKLSAGTIGVFQAVLIIIVSLYSGKIIRARGNV